MCMQQYEDPFVGGKSIKFLELLNKSVMAGVEYFLTSSTLLPLLPFLRKILLSQMPPSSAFEWNLLQLVHTVCIMLACAFRSLYMIVL